MCFVRKVAPEKVERIEETGMKGFGMRRWMPDGCSNTRKLVLRVHPIGILTEGTNSNGCRVRETTNTTHDT